MAENPLTKLPFVGQLGLSAFVAAAIGGAFYFFYWQDAVVEEAKKQKDLDGLRADIRVLEAAERDLPGLKQKVADYEKQLDVLKRILPADKETPDLIRKIQYLAASANLSIKKFNPSGTVSKDFYQEWPISVDVEGTYHNLALFFDRVSRLSRLVNVGNLKVKSQTTPLPNNTIAASCTATTFVYVETPPAAPAKPGQK